MYIVNLRLIFGVFLVISVLCPQLAKAQNIKAEPVIAVAKESLSAVNSDAPVLVELFSTQACFFCPQAERLFADLIKQKNIIGLSCHVDYFDVKQNALSHDFCSKRQARYVEQLQSGFHYTPQMVVDGRIDVVAHKFDDVKLALDYAAKTPPRRLEIKQNGKTYTVHLPAQGDAQKQSMDLWLASYNKPQDVIISEGRNRGKKVSFHNIVSKMEHLGTWDGAARDQDITPLITDKQNGFAFIVQDRNTGKVTALADYKITK
jgi:hypothetical protein